MSGLLIGKAIYSILSGDSSIHSYLQDKIYPIFAPDETVNPFIVYQRTNVNTLYTKDGLVYDEVSVAVNVVSDNYIECVSIAELVRTSLELKVGTFGNVNILHTLLTNVSEDYGVDGFITTLEFAIKCK